MRMNHMAGAEGCNTVWPRCDTRLNKRTWIISILWSASPTLLSCDVTSHSGGTSISGASVCSQACTSGEPRRDSRSLNAGSEVSWVTPRNWVGVRPAGGVCEESISWDWNEKTRDNSVCQFGSGKQGQCCHRANKYPADLKQCEATWRHRYH